MYLLIHQAQAESMRLEHYLHSIMYLLIRIYYCQQLHNRFHLHSIMYLLIHIDIIFNTADVKIYIP